MVAPTAEKKTPKGRKSLKVDIKTADTGNESSTSSTAGTPRSAPSPAQDLHPYARGAVIEVWYIPKKTGEEEEWWWTESSSDDEDELTSRSTKSLRLCDIIDRAPVPNKPDEWKYYVHYRDFNRRMDEWINTDRIVSPPSIGNAKAKLLKKEEEKKHKKRKQPAEEVLDVLGPRQSRRRSVGQIENEEASRTRLSRKKSMDDDATIVASNTADDDEEDLERGRGAKTKSSGVQQAVSNGETNNTNKKEIVALSAEAVTTHTVDGHVVATFNAVELDEHEGLDEQSLREHEEVTKVKNVAFLELGQFQMETWYFSPLPKELLGPSGFLEVLYVCEFTLRMFSRKSELLRFQKRLPTENRHPPGDEIYRKGNLSMFEVDAQQEEIYCQNLSYIAKLFLDHKTLYFSVSPFLFYVLCEVDERGYHPVGYFSKEKYSDVGYNLACILTFPSHQRKGYGRFLIAFSYELSKKEEKVGSPEKPMSDLGQQAYKPYWTSTIIDFLLNQSDESELSIMDISKRTSIMAEDIVFTLNQLGLLKFINGVYFITAEKTLLMNLAKKYPVKEPRVDSSRLHWTPFLTDIKRDKFSIHSKKSSVSEEGKAK
ncbi:histone acetyltransferase MYST1 [Fistulifera solaris]|uniref:Histone acetyltransferase n=1 Tax=Fistulifera solaris TaxID=1519565 RepID=A0A1Z5JR61_FISSO|nr:histone acetyltransferase MYST1 [Fistulifera solaris]|eukprot:GAX16261.1 histone acetyltransferase MYST1 [Fistulifera solaris]